MERRSLLVFGDGLALSIAVWLSFWIRLESPVSRHWLEAGPWIIVGALGFGLPLFVLTGQYKSLTRYVESRSFYQLALRNGLLMLLLIAFGQFLRLPPPPRSCWLLFWVCSTGLIGLSRFMLRDILWRTIRRSRQEGQKNVAIYGAGNAGIQLASALKHSGMQNVVVFLDDDSSLWGRTIGGVPIQSPNSFLNNQPQVDQVLLAIPSISKSARRKILSSIQDFECPILEVPSFDALTSGQARIDALKPVSIEDLLGRDQATVSSELLPKSFVGKVVCVTGAGGSIGSELCRQILKLQPDTLILLERSEPALYAIKQELEATTLERIKLVPILGSAINQTFLVSVFQNYHVNVLIHAAAYKHVPLVEANPLAGIRNNVGSTRSVCRAAVLANLDQVMLISTDKAVRPTNVMGASKRLSELVVQAAANQSKKTCFSMVRFGNVLDSSGSVVPLFRKQIKSGGPITLTHPDIVRYFMTIPEATQLVLQATGLAKGGEVFLLDMGKPVLIRQLAEQMVRLSGLELKNDANPDGDIEIICTGLRPGEKLFEELLIEGNAQPTIHPLIYSAHEHSFDSVKLELYLDQLEIAWSQQDKPKVLSLLKLLVPEWDWKKSTPTNLVSFPVDRKAARSEAG